MTGTRKTIAAELDGSPECSWVTIAGCANSLATVDPTDQHRSTVSRFRRPVGCSQGA